MCQFKKQAHSLIIIHIIHKCTGSKPLILPYWESQTIIFFSIAVYCMDNFWQTTIDGNNTRSNEQTKVVARYSIENKLLTNPQKRYNYYKNEH